MENFGLTAVKSGVNRVGQTGTKSGNCLGQTGTKINSVFVRKRDKIESCPKIVLEGQTGTKSGKCPDRQNYIYYVYINLSLSQGQ